MKILAVISTLLVAGCSFKVDAWELEQFQKACADRGGIAFIETVITSWATCKDGKMVRLERGK